MKELYILSKAPIRREIISRIHVDTIATSYLVDVLFHVVYDFIESTTLLLKKWFI